jgi:hypothetical protein
MVIVMEIYLMMNMEDIPKEFIDNNVNNYKISDYGRIKNKHGKNKKGIIRWIFKSYDFTKCVFFTPVSSKIFIPNPDNKETVNHKDGNKLNSKASNLEWMTNSENIKHAHDTD